MESNQKLGNISISGSGSAGGGTYDTIKISGSGKLTGDTVCNEFKCSGSSKVENKLAAGTAKVSGSAKFVEDLKADYLSISGSSTLLANLSVKELKTSGSIRVDGTVDAEEIHVSGTIKIAKDCNAEAFYLSGGCQIGGLLNAGEIEIKLAGRCEISSIGTEVITVKHNLGQNIITDLFGSLFNQDAALYSEIIEGDEIYLENTICKMVRGNTVRIGKGCKIETVEYSGTLEVADQGKVVNSIQV